MATLARAAASATAATVVLTVFDFPVRVMPKTAVRRAMKSRGWIRTGTSDKPSLACSRRVEV